MSVWIRRATVLAWITIFYNLIEGIVSIGFGAGEESLALFGFGLDSFVEVFSASLVLMRFRSTGDLAGEIKKERKAVLGIGLLLVILALGVAAGSVIQLVRQSHPETTLPGVIIALVSLFFMFFLYRAKLEVADALGSDTIRKDAACSLACIQLSIVLLLGSGIYYVLPTLWWADSLAAMGLAFMIAKEGFESVRAARDPGFTGGCGCG